jgi:hypothetical protein
MNSEHTNAHDEARASEKQLLYARILHSGRWLGFATLIVTFSVYLSGILPGFVPIRDLARYWGMSVRDYNAALNAPTGWQWTAFLGKGDYLNFIGIAILSGLTIVCFLAILPVLIRKKMTAYVVIAILEVLVLVLAASNLIRVGGH